MNQHTTLSDEQADVTNESRALIQFKLKTRPVTADSEDSTSSAPLESSSIGLLGRVREVVDLFLQRLALRLKFTYLLLEGRVLRLQLDNLSERNRQLKVRLVGLRRWHVQYPSVDETGVSAVESGDEAGARSVRPNV